MQVFQASALVLGDLRVLKDPAFLAVSMTAQQWVPSCCKSLRETSLHGSRESKQLATGELGSSPD